MTRRAVVAVAVVSAAAAALLGAVWPWWVVLVAEVAIAAAGSWWTYTAHAGAIAEELATLRRATSSSDTLLLWEARRHDDGRWSLSWARGAPLLAWRESALYEPAPDEPGPYGYWLATWDDPSGERDRLLAAALDTGDPQSWLTTDRGRVFDTEAIATSHCSVLCITHDVTGAERHGADRGRRELVATARALDTLRAEYAHA